MNSWLLKYLVSPVDRQPLVIRGCGHSQTPCVGPIEQGTLLDRYSNEEFPIVEGVPLLHPKGHVADYSHNVLDIVLLEDRKLLHDLVKVAIKDPQEYERRVLEFVTALGKDGVRSAFRKYSERSPDERLTSFLSPRDSASHVPTEEEIRRGRECSSAAFGKRRAEQMREMIDKWAAHVPQYVTEVFAPAPTLILELGSGAGVGTSALLDRGLSDARLICVDIDFVACRPAEGLARWFEVKDRVDPIVASFWFLPLEDNSVDVVCAHYGVDEAREVTRILEEVARVLVGDGVFVNVSRADPTLRLSHYLEPLGFDHDELSELALVSDLYPGPDALIGIAAGYGLVLHELRRLSHPSSHERVLFTFKKAS